VYAPGKVWLRLPANECRCGTGPLSFTRRSASWASNVITCFCPKPPITMQNGLFVAL
jgi:hypothetical protein